MIRSTATMSTVLPPDPRPSGSPRPVRSPSGAGKEPVPAATEHDRAGQTREVTDDVVVAVPPARPRTTANRRGAAYAPRRPRSVGADGNGHISIAAGLTGTSSRDQDVCTNYNICSISEHIDGLAGRNQGIRNQGIQGTRGYKWVKDEAGPRHFCSSQRLWWPRAAQARPTRQGRRNRTPTTPHRPAPSAPARAMSPPPPRQ